MISAVLLIAFTVAVAGIVSTWLPGFFGGVTGSVEAGTENQTKCAGVYIDIFRVTSLSNSSVVLFLRNPSSQDITSINVLTDTGVSLASVGTLAQGQLISVVSDKNTTQISGTQEILASGLCLNSVSVTGSCAQDDPCWQL